MREIKDTEVKCNSNELEKEFFALAQPTRYVLSNTGDYKELPQEQVEILEYLYSSKSPNLRFLATIMNSLSLNNFRTFMISQAELNKLLENDKNQRKSNSIGGKSYRNFIHAALSGSYFSRIREPIGGKCGVYEVTNPLLLKFFNEGNDFYAKQKEDVLAIYSRSHKNTQDPSDQKNENATNDSDIEEERIDFGSY